MFLPSFKILTKKNLNLGDVWEGFGVGKEPQKRRSKDGLRDSDTNGWRYHNSGTSCIRDCGSNSVSSNDWSTKGGICFHSVKFVRLLCPLVV